MQTLPVVENGRRRRRRRLTARQLAAGFGGRSHMRRKRRRNPGLASFAMNPRRRRRHHYRRRHRRSYGGYSVAHMVRRRRYRNPSLFGGLGLGGFDFMAAVWVGAGAVGSTAVPGLIRRWWPSLPSDGVMGYVVRAGGTFVTAYAVKLLTKSPRNFQLTLAGGFGLILVDLFRQYVAPNVGLSGLLGADTGLVNTSEIQDAMSGYTDYATLRGYVNTDSLSGSSDSLVPTFIG